MNVYDFDRTIYDGDSSVDFFFFCLKSDLRLSRYLVPLWKVFILYKRGKVGKKELKEQYFAFLQEIPDVKGQVLKFWKVYSKKIKRWYMKQHMYDDLIITASPEFLIKPIANLIGVNNVIGTVTDINTGKFISENCKGIEKVRRFKEAFPYVNVEKFYSDSISDSPMADLAKKAYIVKRNRIKEWTGD